VILKTTSSQIEDCTYDPTAAVPGIDRLVWSVVGGSRGNEHDLNRDPHANDLALIELLLP
jgi:hypothetical protein